MSDAAAAIPLPLPDPEPSQRLKASEPETLIAAPEPASETAPDEMKIHWDRGTVADWHALLAQVHHSTIEQALPYGETMRRRLFVPRRGVIEIGGETVGLVQMHEINTLGLHCVIVERGPLWLDPDPPARWWQLFLDLFADETYPRLGRFRRFLPEMPASDAAKRMLETAGLEPAHRDAIPRRSIWVDLSRGEEARFRGLRADWRQTLVGAGKVKLKIEAETSGASLGWLIGRAAADCKDAGIAGLSLGFIKALANAHFTEGTGILFKATGAGGPVAGALIARHGDCATYLLGWGKKEVNGALHLLMWRAMQQLEAHGVKSLDLGAFTSQSPEDMIAFKRGLGGEPYDLLPMFR